MKYTLYFLLLCISISGIFSSCISSEEINYLQAIDKQYPLQEFTEYKLDVGDMISCAISSSDQELVSTFNTVITNNQNVLKTYTIYEDSTVILPFFGTAKVAGHTIQEAEIIIQNLMQQSVKDVQVKVTMANNFFYIYANDKRGSYQVYKDNMTIYQALAISQQTTGLMDLTRVSIVRKGPDGNTQVKTFDLRSQDVIQSEYYYIKPNDVIYFPTNKNSFFDISSMSSFITTMSVPLQFLLYSIIYRGF
ncbi:MAG: polysaccharide biosynthesis/export family protein [Dysgonomonas sp.]|jgi:polysaccharide export outer membrane protein|uniref:polysaccharide biosynthesis/export family protein n=1 Tax=unclassified Dysgonomonas TaxID=2630389 RepID=UPI0025B900D2|nr:MULTISPECIES: polysaccharide biosynthesis/export family protein [unclassified Dysgonomonas]MDR1715383.1 polysaccharide biosynthesis/export family protein [Prevotella sp.]MDR2004925.1 polysaccharide biosynthesis/export family protein [Prevotella sp.]HMM01661.1 polysaccharide biosynthesis/export family protein [Dysgonomonas sp.]